jgi:hypothetical protein
MEADMAKADDSREVPEGAAVLPQIPEELGVDPLLLALLHAVVFLDGSDAKVVDPAAAAEALEFIAGYLQRLAGTDLQRVKEDLDCLASFAREDGWSKQGIAFLKEFLGSFGVGKA